MTFYLLLLFKGRAEETVLYSYRGVWHFWFLGECGLWSLHMSVALTKKVNGITRNQENITPPPHVLPITVSLSFVPFAKSSPTILIYYYSHNSTTLFSFLLFFFFFFSWLRTHSISIFNKVPMKILQVFNMKQCDLRSFDLEYLV